MTTTRLGKMTNKVEKAVRDLGELIVLVFMLIGYWIVVNRGPILVGFFTTMFITQAQNNISIERVQNDLTQMKAQIVLLKNNPSQ